MEFDREECFRKETARRLNVKGAHGSTLAIRTHVNFKKKKRLELSGNPIKFLQGHNVFGSGDLLSLMNQTFDVLCAGCSPTLEGYSSEEIEILKEAHHFVGQGPFYQVTPTEEERNQWARGNYRISRIDLTAMVELASRAEVRAVLNSLRGRATIHRRGAGSWYDGTLYFGLTNKGSRATPWMIKGYCKADEMKLNEVPKNIDDFDKPKAAREWGGNLPDDIPHRDELCAWADNKLRVELTLRTAALRKHGLQWAHSWTQTIADEVFKSYLKQMNIGGIVCDAVEDNPSLSLSLRRTFSEWKRGVDVRQYMNRQTFSRHRKEILDITGCDISGDPLTEAPRLDLQKILVDKISPAPVPAWALGETEDIPF
ncbi:MAG: phage/plasmid replication protein, II/X family [Alphaproteobacteria bacterium]|nr:phage/plasmid replication protein, II/X family [Alphaproteobacteria bacterium]